MMTKKSILLGFFFAILCSIVIAQGTEPVVYLEFSDFSGFLTDLGQERSYKNFMASSVKEWFSNTRLGLKLPKRLKEFEEILGFSLSLNNVNSLAGSKTGLWLFDIGELKLLMVTKMGESEYIRSKISQSKARFGEGKIDDTPYYYKKDESGNKEIDFAFVEGYLILSNEPEEFELFLKRLVTDKDFVGWKNVDFLDWVEKSEKSEYDILLYLSPESVRNTYFTSYWFFENQKEIREWCDKGVIYISKDDKRIEEKRIYKLVEGFSFDSLGLKRVPEIFPFTPNDVDFIEVKPFFGEDLGSSIRRLIGGGTEADSLYSEIEAMGPLCYGDFVQIKEGELLPELQEGIAILVKAPDRRIEKVFDHFYPKELRTHELFSKNMPDFSIEGNILLFSNSHGFFKHRETLKESGISFYSWMDFRSLSQAFTKEISLLGESERWYSFENRDFFVENISDLNRIVSSYLKEIEKKGIVNQNFLSEKLIYYTK
jgi:hypothetical protein